MLCSYISNSSQQQSSQSTLCLWGEQLHVSHGRGHTQRSGSRYWAGSGDRWRSTMLSSSSQVKAFPFCLKILLHLSFPKQKPLILQRFLLLPSCMYLHIPARARFQHKRIGTVCYSSHNFFCCYNKIFCKTVHSTAPWEMKYKSSQKKPCPTSLDLRKCRFVTFQSLCMLLRFSPCNFMLLRHLMT